MASCQRAWEGLTSALGQRLFRPTSFCLSEWRILPPAQVWAPGAHTAEGRAEEKSRPACLTGEGSQGGLPGEGDLTELRVHIPPAEESGEKTRTLQPKPRARKRQGCSREQLVSYGASACQRGREGMLGAAGPPTLTLPGRGRLGREGAAQSQAGPGFTWGGGSESVSWAGRGRWLAPSNKAGFTCPPVHWARGSVRFSWLRPRPPPPPHPRAAALVE